MTDTFITDISTIHWPKAKCLTCIIRVGFCRKLQITNAEITRITNAYKMLTTFI